MEHDAWVEDYYFKADGSITINEITPDEYKVGADGFWNGLTSK